MAKARSRPTAPSSRRLLRSLATDTEGAALIEITLFMPILALMAAAIINFGLYFSYSIQVVNAAQAGAQLAITNAVQNGYSSSSTTTAGQDANNTSLAITVTPTLKCGCVSGSSLTLSTWTASCATATCGTYVQVVASGTFVPFATYGSFFPSSYPLSSTATVRIQ
jgi:Flp pilus assembly protein TadG